MSKNAISISASAFDAIAGELRKCGLPNLLSLANAIMTLGDIRIIRDESIQPLSPEKQNHTSSADDLQNPAFVVTELTSPNATIWSKEQSAREWANGRAAAEPGKKIAVMQVIAHAVAVEPVKFTEYRRYPK